MYIKNDMDFNDLMNNCWSGAVDTLKTIEAHGKEDELMAHLEEIFNSYFNNIPTMTEVNDYLWFEDEAIFEALGISETEDEKEEEEIQLDNFNKFNDLCLGRKCLNCPLWNIPGDCEQNFNLLKTKHI